MYSPFPSKLYSGHGLWSTQELDTHLCWLLAAPLVFIVASWQLPCTTCISLSPNICRGQQKFALIFPTTRFHSCVKCGRGQTEAFLKFITCKLKREISYLQNYQFNQLFTSIAFHVTAHRCFHNWTALITELVSLTGNLGFAL